MQRTLPVRLKNIVVSFQTSYILVDTQVGPCQKNIPYQVMKGF